MTCSMRDSSMVSGGGCFRFEITGQFAGEFDKEDHSNDEDDQSGDLSGGEWTNEVFLRIVPSEEFYKTTEAGVDDQID